MADYDNNNNKHNNKNDDNNDNKNDNDDNNNDNDNNNDGNDDKDDYNNEDNDHNNSDNNNKSYPYTPVLSCTGLKISRSFYCTKGLKPFILIKDNSKLFLPKII